MSIHQPWCNTVSIILILGTSWVHFELSYSTFDVIKSLCLASALMVAQTLDHSTQHSLDIIRAKK